VSTTLVERLRELVERASEAEDVGYKLLYLRYCRDVMYWLWRLERNAIAFLVLNTVAPAINILTDIVKRRGYGAEEVATYVDRAVAVVEKLIDVLKQERSRALNTLLQVIEKDFLPLVEELIDRRNSLL